MKTIKTALIAIIVGVMMIYIVALMTLPAHANSATDYNDNSVSEQISAEWQRDPTNEELRYMQQYTAQKQEEINRTLEVERNGR